MFPGAQSLLLVSALSVPLALVAAWAVPQLRAVVGRLVPWAPLPALAAALLVAPGSTVALDWVLFGGVLGLTDVSRVFLLFTSVLWAAAGIHARGYLKDDPRRSRFDLFWLLSCLGNLGLILALDVVGFYAAFALMTFAAYGLVVHTGSPDARHAGRIYLAMAVLGEALILAGLVLLVAQAGSPGRLLLVEVPGLVATSGGRDWLIAFLWLGFGVKAGLPLLHLWLPLAHPAAPAPASAVLSGAMIKAGLLGWLHMLPIGIAGLPGWSAVVTFAGLAAAFGAAFVALHQSHPKTVLAYSSVSQMGLITVGVGMALQVPDTAPLLVAAVSIYAFHHALAKGALFLGVVVARHPGRLGSSPLFWLLLTLPALSLSGVLTTGITAKLGLKRALHGANDVPGWWAALPFLMQLAAVGTTLVMARYLWTLHAANRGDRAPAGVWIGWLTLLVAGPALIWLPAHWGLFVRAGVTGGDVIGLAWPVAAGVLLAFFGLRRLRAWRIPPGDLLVPILSGWVALKDCIGRRSAYPDKPRQSFAWAGSWGAALRAGSRRPDLLWQRETALALAVVAALLLFSFLF